MLVISSTFVFGETIFMVKQKLTAKSPLKLMKGKKESVKKIPSLHIYITLFMESFCGVEIRQGFAGVELTDPTRPETQECTINHLGQQSQLNSRCAYSCATFRLSTFNSIRENLIEHIHANYKMHLLLLLLLQRKTPG